MVSRALPNGLRSTCRQREEGVTQRQCCSPLLQSAAERVKAQMKLQLSEMVSKDTAKGMTGEWERFDFSSSAPLDDDASLQRPENGETWGELSVHHEAVGASLFSSQTQKKEAQLQAAHDAAIFGHAATVGADRSGPAAKVDGKRSQGLSKQPAVESLCLEELEGATLVEEEETNVVQARPSMVGAMQEQEPKAPPWQERARLLRASRAAAASAAAAAQGQGT
eukprot:SM000313S11975  [mRNA]  locus=s313:108556:109958:- [translate_table: standard]